jgi:hypothetical protein
MMRTSRGSAPGAEDSAGGELAATQSRRERDGENLAEGRARKAAVSCEDCFFRRRGLCALGLDAPCPTFRPDTPEGLVPPRQPSLLMRDRVDAATAQVAVQAA